jgi:hypothetical protein
MQQTLPAGRKTGSSARKCNEAPRTVSTIMTEDQLRALVRDAVARHLGPGRAVSSNPLCAAGPVPPAAPEPRWTTHASHFRLPVLSGEQGDGPCIVEPQIRCHHCGFCQSFGH